MRVLLLLDNYEITACSQAVLLHCERWKAMRQVNISCVAFGPAGPLEERLRKLGVGTQSVPAKTIRDLTKLKEEGEKFLYRKDRPDLLLAFCRWPAMQARLFQGGNPYVPLILSIDDDAEQAAPSFAVRMAESFRERGSRDHLRMIVAPTMRAKKALLARGIPEEKIARIAPGVNAVEAYPLPDHKRARYRMLMGIAHDAPLVVSVCPLENAAVDELINIMKDVTARIPGAKLFIFGDGAARENVLKRINDAGLAGSVTLIGAMTSILAKIFSSADVSIHTCAGGSSYTLVAEAQACATPVVAYRTGCLDELIIDGQTGVLVEGGNRAKLAEAVIGLLNDGERRKEMGANARTFILEHHEVTDSAEEYVKLWRTAAPEADWKTTTGSISLEELNEIKNEAQSGVRTPPPVKRDLKGKLS